MTWTRTAHNTLATGIIAAGVCLLASFSPAMAEDNGGPGQEQLDRIEQKLDRILKQLDAVEVPKNPSKAGAAALPSPSEPASSSSKPPSKTDGAIPDKAQAQTDGAAYQAGAVVIAHAAPERASALPNIPADSIGGFVYTGGAIPLHDLSAKGVRYTGLAAVELQGWLKVAEAGRTQIAVEYRTVTGANANVYPDCIAAVWLEGRSIGSKSDKIPMPARQEKTISLILGADLQPGLYRMRVWAACTPPRDLRQLTAELLIKSPGDMNLRVVRGDDLLHQGR